MPRPGMQRRPFGCEISSVRTTAPGAEDASRAAAGPPPRPARRRLRRKIRRTRRPAM